jgi:hypothetical protein
MWKLLRNLVLGAILLAGVLKLLAWYEVGQHAQRLGVALAPYAQVHYDSISAGLDGSVSLGGVTATIKRGAAQEVYRADSVVLESPSVFWLLKHTLLGNNTLPSHFGISMQGLKLPVTSWLDPQWFNPATLVPFETLGCGATAFTPADYDKMGIIVGDTSQHLDYHYDADSKRLDLALALVAPAFANLTLEAELHPFDPQSPMALEKLHIDQLSADYSDTGYLQRRNQFCAQRIKIGPTQFTERHVAAAQELLAQHHIQAGNDLVKLYRHLVEKGGQASVLSLPNSSFVAGTWSGSTPEDLLRLLNVTARYGDSSPVMFRLSFPPPANVEPASLAAETPAPTPASTAMPAAAEAPSVPKVGPTPSASVVVPTPMPVAASTATPAPTSPPAHVAPATVTPTAMAESTPNAAVPALVHVPAPTPAQHDLNRTDLNRAEIPLTPPPKLAASAHPVTPPKPAASAGNPGFLPSAPPPDAGSTLALIWKPTLERLEAPVPEPLHYQVIEYARLKDEQGRRVRLVTAGGKRVEGYVLAVDDAGVALRINGGDVGGDVQFVIPKTRIQQIQLLHRDSPPA